MRSLLWFNIKLTGCIALVLALLAACGGGGGGGSDSNSPAATAPVIERFAAEPGYLVSGSGNSTTLVWQVSGANHLTIIPGVGEVSGASGTKLTPSPN